MIVVVAEVMVGMVVLVAVMVDVVVVVMIVVVVEVMVVKPTVPSCLGQSHRPPAVWCNALITGPCLLWSSREKAAGISARPLSA